MSLARKIERYERKLTAERDRNHARTMQIKSRILRVKTKMFDTRDGLQICICEKGRGAPPYLNYACIDAVADITLYGTIDGVKTVVDVDRADADLKNLRKPARRMRMAAERFPRPADSVLPTWEEVQEAVREYATKNMDMLVNHESAVLNDTRVRSDHTMAVVYYIKGIELEIWFKFPAPEDAEKVPISGDTLVPTWQWHAHAIHSDFAVV